MRKNIISFADKQYNVAENNLAIESNHIDIRNNEYVAVPALQNVETNGTITFDENTNDVIIKGNWGKGSWVNISTKDITDKIFIRGDWGKGSMVALKSDNYENDVELMKSREDRNGIPYINYDQTGDIIFRDDPQIGYHMPDVDVSEWLKENDNNEKTDTNTEENNHNKTKKVQIMLLTIIAIIGFAYYIFKE